MLIGINFSGCSTSWTILFSRRHVKAANARKRTKRFHHARDRGDLRHSQEFAGGQERTTWLGENWCKKNWKKICHLNTLLHRKGSGCLRKRFSGICVANLVCVNMLRANSWSMKRFWRTFMHSCLQVAVHLDKDGDQSQRVLRNMDVDLMQKMLSTTLNQVQSLQERELTGLRGQQNGAESQWKSCNLLHDSTCKQLQAHVCVFVDSVLCINGKCQPHPLSGEI